ncbi:hypothetical protein D2V93_05765 [Flagellimonas taeanensis]|uniref:hypothetical protein n=1 Tax=Flavobacteriaceae TaxID=49546 RepID=UPI000E6A3797|nr:MULTISPECIES: hypothetical protein [Allomuricauda]MDC6384471.1 hypothetical protein [Muricauda sp. SK9]RIV52153.1 hypothetical protein D2V93_05765 [Allomuricauda taeanensis]
MRPFNKLQLIGLLLVSSLLLVIHSCAKEEPTSLENPNIDVSEVDNPPIMESGGDGIEDDTKSSSSLTGKTTCDITGTSTPQAGNQYTFTYTTNMSSPTVTWTVLSGAITLVSTSGNSATFQFGSGFSSGSIKAHGTNGTVECSDTISFRQPTISCPQQSCLNILQVEPCIDYQAVLSCANNVSSVDWEYSIGPYSHVSIGSSTNPGGNYAIAKPIYLPTGSWDNYYLWIFADITLTNGSTCTLSKSILLSCGSGGGGNQ